MSLVMIEEVVKPLTNLSEKKYLWISKGKSYPGAILFLTPNFIVDNIEVFFAFLKSKLLHLTFLQYDQESLRNWQDF